jgi:hypothetical protein
MLGKRQEVICADESRQDGFAAGFAAGSGHDKTFKVAKVGTSHC